MKEIKLFIFGNIKDHNPDSSVTIRSDNYDFALKHFKISCLFPEECVDIKCIEKREYKHSDLGHNIYTFKKTPYINVYIAELEDPTSKYNYYDKAKFYKRIMLSEVIDVNYNSLTPLKQIEYQQQDKETNSTELQCINDIIPLPKKDISDYTKMEMRNTHDLIKSKMEELEQKRRELNTALSLLKEELNKKLKLLYVLETYLGLKEEVFQLLEGEKAAEDIPISVYQMKLYMDEEVGLIENDGIDFKNIEVFDEWIKKHYKQFLYKTKSICVWQVRRNDKEYSENPFVNIVMNQGNKVTYFLIRNGDNLYRIFSDVHIGGRFFPTKDEYDILLNDKTWGEHNKSVVQDKHEIYMYGMIAVQGLIERTDIFGTNFRHVKLFMPGGFTEKEINLIRDDEPDFYISQKECWSEFVKKNRESIHQGTRIILCRINDYACGYRNVDWRSDPFHPYSHPDPKELFLVEKESTGKEYYSWKYLFYYWDKGSWHDRKRRVPFRVYSDEVLNYDALTIEDLDYYEKNRYERRNYLKVLFVIHYAKKLKIKEKELEDNFIKFMQGQYFPDMDTEEIRPYLRWWKLKNKWKRELTKDDAKAVRMIQRKINKDKEESK